MRRWQCAALAFMLAAAAAAQQPPGKGVRSLSDCGSVVIVMRSARTATGSAADGEASAYQRVQAGRAQGG
jgi:hypothetical protein